MINITVSTKQYVSARKEITKGYIMCDLQAPPKLEAPQDDQSGMEDNSVDMF
jgi:hypothetical protein